MNKTSVVLFSTVAILGAYIFVNLISDLLLGSKKDYEFNIGCFVVEHSVNRSQQLLGKIERLKHQQEMSKIRVTQESLPFIESSELHNKSIALAVSFEKFIKKMTQQHDYNLENVYILREVAKAQKEYLSCKISIEQSYSVKDCEANWNQYQNCSTRMDLVSTKIKHLSDEQKDLHKQISKLIKIPEGSISTLERLKKKYNQKMSENQQKRVDISEKLSDLQKNLRDKNYEKDEIFEKYELTRKNFRQCQESKMKHHACEQISKQVRKINSQNIQYLKVMMQSKKELLSNLQKILNSQRNSKQIQQFNEKFIKHKQQYINMLKEFISLTRENQKACGCTAELEEEYKVEFEKLKSQQISITKQVTIIVEKIAEANRLLEANELQRQEIVQSYKEALQKGQNGPQSDQYNLTKANKDLNKKFKEILDLKKIYQKITFQCDLIKARMSVRIKDINRIGECVSKKNYFLELKKQTIAYIHSDKDEMNKMLQSKRQLSQYLQKLTQI